MKNLLKFTYVALVGAIMAAFASCTNDFDYTAAQALTADQVGFLEEQDRQITLETAQTQFQVPVYRFTKGEAATVKVKAEVADDSYISLATDVVTFAADAEEGFVTFNCDTEKMEPQKYYTVKLYVDDPDATVYSNSVITLLVGGLPLPPGQKPEWETLGLAKFADWFFFEDFIEVAVEQNTTDADLYRLVDPYEGGLNSDLGEPYLYFRLLHKGDMDPIRGQYEIPEDDMVLVYGPNSTGFTSFGISTGYKNASYDGAIIYAVFPGAFNNYADPANWAYTRVVGYKEDGTPGQIDFAPYYYMNGIGGWNYFQKAPVPGDGGIQIIMPGYDPKDYTAEVEALGRFINTKEKGQAIFNVNLGADVASAKVAMAAGKDPMAAYQLIMDGDESVQELNASGEVRFAYNEPGDYVCVVAAYDAEGNEVAAVYALINIPDNAEKGEVFEAVFEGVYTHGFENLSNGSLPFGESFQDPATLYVSTDNDSKFMISPWINKGYEETESLGEGMVFIWDDEDNITVPGSLTGVVNPTYGELWAWDLVTAGIANMPCSFDEESMTFYFNLAWSVEAGNFGFTTDTYQLTGYAAAPAKAKAKKVAKDQSMRFRKVETDANFKPLMKKAAKKRNFKLFSRSAKPNAKLKK